MRWSAQRGIGSRPFRPGLWAPLIDDDGPDDKLVAWIEPAIARIGAEAAARLRQGEVIVLPAQPGVVSGVGCGLLLAVGIIALSVVGLSVATSFAGRAASVFWMVVGAGLLIGSIAGFWPHRHGDVVLEQSGPRARPPARRSSGATSSPASAPANSSA